MTSPFSDRDQRIAFFQQWFSDTIPHSKALGLKIIAVRRGFGSMQLEWREELGGRRLNRRYETSSRATPSQCHDMRDIAAPLLTFPCS